MKPRFESGPTDGTTKNGRVDFNLNASEWSQEQKRNVVGIVFFCQSLQLPDS